MFVELTPKNDEEDVSMQTENEVSQHFEEVLVSLNEIEMSSSAAGTFSTFKKNEQNLVF